MTNLFELQLRYIKNYLRGSEYQMTYISMYVPMVVDSVVQNWVIVAMCEDVGTEGFVRAVQRLDALFYMDNLLLMSPRTAHLKEALDVLVGLFGRAVLQTKADKKVGMICQSCCTAS